MIPRTWVPAWARGQVPCPGRARKLGWQLSPRGRSVSGGGRQALTAARGRAPGSQRTLSTTHKWQSVRRRSDAGRSMVSAAALLPVWLKIHEFVVTDERHQLGDGHRPPVRLGKAPAQHPVSVLSTRHPGGKGRPNRSRAGLAHCGADPPASGGGNGDADATRWQGCPPCRPRGVCASRRGRCAPGCGATHTGTTSRTLRAEEPVMGKVIVTGPTISSARWAGLIAIPLACRGPMRPS